MKHLDGTLLQGGEFQIIHGVLELLLELSGDSHGVGVHGEEHVLTVFGRAPEEIFDVQRISPHSFIKSRQ